MIISHETYYEENLKGKTASQIMSAIRGIKQEIGRLKSTIEHPNYKCMMLPSEETRIWCNRLYLEQAKKALAKTGGTYTPSKAEEKAAEFDANIPFISKMEFGIGNAFDCFETRTYTIHGDEVYSNIERSLSLKLSDTEGIQTEEMDAESFLDEIKDLHIGEWRRNYDPSRWGYAVLDGTQWHLYTYYSNGRRGVKIEGSNDYPYNFNRLLELFNVEP